MLKEIGLKQLRNEVVVSFKSANGPEKTKITDKSPVAREYRTLIWNKIGFTVSEETYQDFKNGKLAAMIVEEQSRTITAITKDDEGNDVSEEKEVPSYRFIKAVTKSQLAADTKFDVQMKQLENLVAAEASSLTPEQIKSLISEDV